MTIHRTVAASLGAVLLAAAAVGGAQDAAAPVRPVVDARNLRMQPDITFPGNTLNVAGDPARTGMYVIRRRFAPGEMTRPHVHDQDRLVTVIKGTWWTGEGDVFAPEKTVPIRTGGFMLHPKGLRHYDGAKDEEVIVQIIGMGPVTTTQLEANVR